MNASISTSHLSLVPRPPFPLLLRREEHRDAQKEKERKTHYIHSTTIWSKRSTESLSHALEKQRVALRRSCECPACFKPPIPGNLLSQLSLYSVASARLPASRLCKSPGHGGSLSQPFLPCQLGCLDPLPGPEVENSPAPF